MDLLVHILLILAWVLFCLFVVIVLPIILSWTAGLLWQRRWRQNLRRFGALCLPLAATSLLFGWIEPRLFPLFGLGGLALFAISVQSLFVTDLWRWHGRIANGWDVEALILAPDRWRYGRKRRKAHKP